MVPSGMRLPNRRTEDVGWKLPTQRNGSRAGCHRGWGGPRECLCSAGAAVAPDTDAGSHEWPAMAVCRCNRGCTRRQRDGCDRQPLDPHDLVQPAVQMAAVALPATVRSDGDAPSTLLEDAVVVLNEEARDLILCSRLADLLLHPVQRRFGRDVDMDDPPGANLHDHEDVDK